MSLDLTDRLNGMKNSRWLSLVVLCAGFLLIVVDMTIVNVALPSIQKDLGFSPSGLAWVVNAYPIALARLPLLARPLLAPAPRTNTLLLPSTAPLPPTLTSTPI